MAVLAVVVAIASLWLTAAPEAYAEAPAANKIWADRALGKADAPVTIVEYASLTCSHCGDFHRDTFEKLKETYIDTGKVRLIFRDFPLDGLSLQAAAIARCMPEESYFPFIGVLYKNQQKWISSADPIKSLTQYAQLGGLSEEKAKSCMENKDLLDGIVAGRTTGQQDFGIEATPSFVFNGGAEKLSGALPFDRFSATIDKLLAKTPAE